MWEVLITIIVAFLLGMFGTTKLRILTLRRAFGTHAKLPLTTEDYHQTLLHIREATAGIGFAVALANGLLAAILAMLILITVR